MKLCCGTIMNATGSGTGQYYICSKCRNIQYPLTINKDENVSIQSKGK
mgnify:CR=1 FL=1